MTMTEKREAEVQASEEESEAQAEVVEQEEVVAEEAAAVEEKPEEAREEEELERLREELEKAKAQAAEYLDGWQRTQAEFSNYKKRQEAERAQVTALANATLLRKLLPIVDDFERALATLPAGLSQLTWCEGVFLIKHKLDAILESEGVKPIETEGQTFDPRYHEAVTHEEVSGYEDGQIIGEVQRGYTLGEWVLRPALVRVAKAPAAPEPEPSEE
ncbi:MAG TPA: nucleotide exchange factor GrpE [Thermoflexia bacterium]|nr:MAG: nucleotide exchange factor GrpE [Chloroflexota bacterium]HEY67224.1 nucleotide exchange factor GrpE [Thermoflexia bacterium]